MSGSTLLEAARGRVRSSVGACFPGSHALFRGHDLHAELRDVDWVELYLFGITGRRFAESEVRLIHALWVNTSYPDARLWNNRVAALAATTRSSANLGVCAGMAISEATVFGGGAGYRAMHFLRRAQRDVAAGKALAEVLERALAAGRIYGYGRPINSVDERIPWLRRKMEELGIAAGPHLRLAGEVEQHLVQRHASLLMNYAALHAAVIADMGLSEREYQLLRVPTFLAGMAPCHVDAAAQPPGTFLPVSCSDVRYEGPAARPWPVAGGDSA